MTLGARTWIIVLLILSLLWIKFLCSLLMSCWTTCIGLSFLFEVRFEVGLPSYLSTPNDIHKIAFQTHERQYEFLAMPLVIQMLHQHSKAL